MTTTTQPAVISEEPTEKRQLDISGIERLLVMGDLSELSEQERIQYYTAVCKSVGLNPLTRPFEYLQLRNPTGEGTRLVLYAKRDATDQLRSIHGISVEIMERTLTSDSSGRFCYEVRARATNAAGRFDEALAVVPLCKEGGEWKTAQSGKRYWQGSGEWDDLLPEAAANAKMKCETKAKRRVTLSIAGLGMLDEMEIADITEPRNVTPAAASPALLRSNPDMLAGQLKAIEFARLHVSKVLDAFEIHELGDLPLSRLPELQARIEQAKCARLETNK